MKIETFVMERFQSTWENRVTWNVSESGVHPLRVEELAETDDDRAAVLAQELGYPQTNGTIELRSAIAALYPGSTPEHVEVTNGGSEANCVTMWHLIEPGDHVVMMVPNYMQVGGLARAFGATVEPWPLVDVRGGARPRWAPDMDRLASIVTSRTKAILICQPNNPTGGRMTSGELDDLCRIAARTGAWVVSDEIYRGAEMEGDDTASAWGRYERTIVTSGLSKAYGLPGLRIGWVVGPPPVVERLWSVHDYTSIAPGAVNDRLARIALAPARRAKLLARTRGIIRTNYPLVRQWIDRRAPALSHIAPEAGAIAYVRYRHAANSTALVERLRTEVGVLVVPGDHFGMDGYLRIGFGSSPDHLSTSLERIGEVLDTVPLPEAHAR